MVNNLKKYLRLYWHLIKFQVQLETEYRGSFILEIFVEVAFFLATLISFFAIFSNISQISGWNIYEVAVLLGVNQIFSELLLGASFILNLRELPSKIAKGGLDLILSKPINSQFMVSLWRPYFAAIPSCVAGLLVIVYGVSRLGINISPLNLIPFLILLGLGLIIGYSFGMIICTLSMWLVNATPLPFLAQQIIFVSRNPRSVFSGVFKFLSMTFVPLAFMVSIPAEMLLGKTSWLIILPAFIIAIVFLKISNMFWLYALRHYSSASS